MVIPSIQAVGGSTHSGNKGAGYIFAPLGSDLRNMLVQLKSRLNNAAFLFLIVIISSPESTPLSAAASLG